MPTKVKVTLDLTYDLSPTYQNKIEIEKMLAFSCHLLDRDRLLTWSDIDLKNYHFRIDTSGREYTHHKKEFTKNSKKIKESKE